MKKKLSITVLGDKHVWNFDLLEDSKYLDEWRADGLEIEEIENTIPMWIVDLGLTKIWCFIQDIFYWKNPFRK